MGEKVSVKFIAEGKITNEIKTFPTTNSVGLKLNISCSRKTKLDVWENSYYSITFWGAYAESAALRLRRGQKVKVEGVVNSKQVDVPDQKWKDTKYEMTGFSFEILAEAKEYANTKKLDVSDFPDPTVVRLAQTVTDTLVQQVADVFGIKQDPAVKEKPKSFVNPFTGDAFSGDDIPF